MKISPNLKPLVEAALEQGWTLKHRGNHLILVPPDRTKPQVAFPSTSVSRRGALNTKSQLRRSGLSI